MEMTFAAMLAYRDLEERAAFQVPEGWADRP
jgi:hypothetical protein